MARITTAYNEFPQSVFLLLCHISNTWLLFYSLQRGYFSNAGMEHSNLLLQANLLHFKQTYFVKQLHPNQILSAILKIFTN